MTATINAIINILASFLALSVCEGMWEKNPERSGRGKETETQIVRFGNFLLWHQLNGGGYQKGWSAELNSH